MDCVGNFNLRGNEIQQAVMQTETEFPPTTSAGRLLFKDKRVFIAMEIVGGAAVWIPLTNELDTYVHVEATAALSWSINHNMNTGSPLVQVLDGSTQRQVIPDEIEITDSNNILVTFAEATAGRAIMMFGNVTGAPKPDYQYTHIQTTLSSTWIVPHGLGHMPVFRVFLSTGEEIWPLTVVHDSLFQTTLTFSAPRVGQARAL